MRSDARQILPEPGMAPVDRLGRTPRDAGPPSPRAVGRVAITALILLLVAWPMPSARAQVDRLPEGTISEIRFEGNATIPSDQIKQKLLSKVGQPLDPQKINADIKTLMGKKWFSDVQIYYEE